MGAYASAYALTGSSYNLVAIRIGALLSGDIFAQPELASAIAVLLGVTMVTAMLLSEWSIKKTRRNFSEKERFCDLFFLLLVLYLALPILATALYAFATDWNKNDIARRINV